MAIVLRSLHLLMILYISNIPLNFAQDESQFIYNGFSQAKLYLDGIAKILPNGLLQLTNFSNQEIGQAFYQFPIKFSKISSLSFSTNFVFAMVPQKPKFGGHGIAFNISPSKGLTHGMATQYLGLFNSSNNGLTSNHILAIELDPVKSPDFDDIDNHVGIDKLLNVTLAPIRTPKPNWPLLSTPINLSQIVLESMYVGFSASTGSVVCDHYILGWSFNKSGRAQSLDISSLPKLPPGKKQKEKRKVAIKALLIVLVVVLITTTGAAYYFRKKKYEEVCEDWESDYGTHRFSYKSLHKATKGFKAREIIGEGGFGKVYRGILPSNEKIAVKRVSHNSQQGMKKFVAKIVSMGRLRHRNLVRLLGYCRRKGELLLIYDYMPHGSLDRFLYRNARRHLNWLQRFRILRGVASGLLYLHEGWEQIVIHRDIKASHVLLDAKMNGRLGDFGLARLYDHDTNSQTTHVAGIIGYLAPELTRTGRATTYTDVFAFGAFMLEVACGMRPIEPKGMPEELSKGDILRASDPRLEGNYEVEEMVLILKLGLLCSHVDPATRPSMRRVMQFLNGEADLPNILYDNASFGRVTSSETLDFLWSPPSSFVQSSDPSMSSTVSLLQDGH
ncbi:hypothetical protein CIPAW_13G089800 [Carya illinoinensis]|uniref:non-specific serine/threonine protein kinase n=1 Tax=Carya illinoinensis TaxID=32201 RepID=A0A8T1NR42_CARIL|nr:hypothetical protein CIPAW_13G089800 [Carya illinoinensis]